MEIKRDDTKEANKIADVNLGIVSAFSAGINLFIITAAEVIVENVLFYGLIGIALHVIALFGLGIYSIIRRKTKNAISYWGSMLVSMMAYIIIACLFSLVRTYLRSRGIYW